MVYQQDEKFLACIFDAMHTTLSSWQETRSCFYISKEHHKSSLTLQPHTIKTLNMKTNMPAYLPTLLLISLTIILGIDTATAEADKDDHLLHLRGTASSNNIEQHGPPDSDDTNGLFTASLKMCRREGWPCGFPDTCCPGLYCRRTENICRRT